MPPRPPFAPRAVVFDLDGLLVDSEPLWAEAEHAVVASFGGRWTPEIQEILLGKGPLDAATSLAAILGVSDPFEVERRMLASAVEHFELGVGVRPGVERLVRALHGRLPIGVATNSRRVIADIALSWTGIADAIDTVVAAEDVARPKPAPDPYEAACARLGVEASRAVAFEDSPLGTQSARAAGMWVIGCPSLPGVDLPDAHVLVSTLHDVDPDLLARAGGVDLQVAVGDTWQTDC